MELSKYIAFHYLLPFQAIDLFIFIINLKIKILNVRVSFLCIVVLLICIIIEYKTSPFSTTAQHLAFKAFHQALKYLHCLYTVFLRNIPPHNELSALSFTYLHYTMLNIINLCVYNVYINNKHWKSCRVCNTYLANKSWNQTSIHNMFIKTSISMSVRYAQKVYITYQKNASVPTQLLLHYANLLLNTQNKNQTSTSSTLQETRKLSFRCAAAIIVVVLVSTTKTCMRCRCIMVHCRRS